MISRKTWFINKIKECIDQLKVIQNTGDWISHSKEAQEISAELLYLSKELDKCYTEINK